MKMDDRVFVRPAGGGETYVLDGIHVVSTVGYTPERTGAGASGDIRLRIPSHKQPNLHLGDLVSRDETIWFSICEIRNNEVSGSGLSHCKVIGRR